MKSTLPDEALNQVFGEARTHGAWLEKPVSDEILRQLYDLMKWGRPVPTVAPLGSFFCARRRQKSAYGLRWRQETWRRR